MIPNGRNIALLVQRPDGSWLRPSVARMPPFSTYREAYAWAKGAGAELLVGQRVVIAELLDMFMVDYVPQRVVRIIRPDSVRSEEVPTPASMNGANPDE